jgi:hypothetical protein
MYLRTLFTQITKIRFCPHQLQNRKVPHLRKVLKSNKLFKFANLRICETYLRNLFGNMSNNMFLRHKISYRHDCNFSIFYQKLYFP